MTAVMSIAIGARCHPIRHNAAFRLRDASFPRNIVQNQIDVRLITYRRGESLELGPARRLLLAKADRVKN